MRVVRWEMVGRWREVMGDRREMAGDGLEMAGFTYLPTYLPTSRLPKMHHPPILLDFEKEWTVVMRGVPRSYPSV